MSDKHKLSDEELVREAGCECAEPIMAYKLGTGPKCVRCGTQVVMVKRGAAY